MNDRPRNHVRIFSQEFVPKILSWEKTMTFRRKPQRDRDFPRLGDRLLLRQWKGVPYRSKQIQIGEADVIECVQVELRHGSLLVGFSDGQQLLTTSPGLLNSYAARDGFHDWRSLTTWIKKAYGLPFRGIMLSWVNFTPSK